MKTITRVAKVSTAFVAVSLLALTGCSSESTTPDDSSSEPAKGESDVKVQELSVDGGAGGMLTLIGHPSCALRALPSSTSIPVSSIRGKVDPPLSASRSKTQPV